MVTANHKNDEISSLKAQLAATDSEDSDAENTEKPTVIAGPYIQDGYFFVLEWGLKFRIPDELANYGYSVDYDTAHQGYTAPTIGFTAMLRGDERQNPQAQYYDNIETCAIVAVSKEPANWGAYEIDGLIKRFDSYSLLIWNYSRHASCDYNLNIDAVQEKIQAMFSNPEAI